MNMTNSENHAARRPPHMDADARNARAGADLLRRAFRGIPLLAADLRALERDLARGDKETAAFLAAVAARAR